MQEFDIDGGGEWDPVEDWPLIGIHAILTLDHELLTFGTDERGMQSAETIYDVWDFETETHFTLENTTGTDIFCSVAAFIPETGEILIIGGDSRPLGTQNLGVDDVNVFNPEDRSLRPADDGDLASARWYASAVTMANGDIVVLGGINGAGAGVRVPELYSAETGWQLLPGIATDATAINGNWWYPRAWPTSDGRIVVLDSDASELYFIHTGGGGTISYYSDLPFSHGQQLPAIMVGEDLILFAADDGHAYLVDISGGQPVIEDAGLTGARMWGGMTLLADGDVLITGGSAIDNVTLGENRQAVIWDRETNTIRQTGEEETHARLYHSSAILLPDGSVFSLGGGAPGPYTHTNGQRYFPEYLYDANGEAANRIEILDAPREIVQQEDFEITVDDPAAVARVTMLKHGSTTHSLNTEARFHEPEFSVRDDGTIIIDPTDNANVLTPGPWMVFVFDENGVPSDAISVAVGTLETANQTPTAPPLLQNGQLTGTAEFLAENLISLTSDNGYQKGAITATDRIDFRQAFEMSFEMYLGDDESGADGLAVIFHNDPRGADATGNVGEGFGAVGIKNGVAIAFDTWANASEMEDDHTNFFDTESGRDLNVARSVGQLEDGEYHPVIMRWDPLNSTLSYSVNGISYDPLIADLENLYFGSELAYLSISAATGGASNEHLVRNVTFNGFTEAGPVGLPPLPGDTIAVREWPSGFETLGTARLLDDGSAFRLTTDDFYNFGAIATNDRVSFASSFMITLSVYLGDDEAGADGIAMAFHNDLRGPEAIGDLGNGLGVAGISNGIGMKLDTYVNDGEIGEDHGVFFRTSDLQPVSEATALGQLEDGEYHAVSIRWNVESQALTYTVDGTVVGNVTGDIVNNYLGGENGAYFLVSAATGGASNEHMVRNIRLMDGSFDENSPDTPDPSNDLTPLLALHGDAARLGSTIQLTSDAVWQAGRASTAQKIDFSQDFEIKATINLGSKDGNGADGMAFVFHNDSPDDLSAEIGGGLGVVGIQNGFGFEIDTYSNSGEIGEDHFNFIDSATGNSLSGLFGLGNIEDGQDHVLRMTWDASEQSLAVILDSLQIGKLEGDATSAYLADNAAYLTIGAATGGLANEQSVEDVLFQGGWLVA